MFWSVLPFSLLLIAFTLQLCYRKVRDRFLRHTLIFLFIAMGIRITIFAWTFVYFIIFVIVRQEQGKIISDADWYLIKMKVNFYAYELPF